MSTHRRQLIRAAGALAATSATPLLCAVEAVIIGGTFFPTQRTLR